MALLPDDNDGGSIPGRADLVKTKKRPSLADPHILAITQWFFCALSRLPLQLPVVSCGLGKLYNKDATLQYLIDRTAFGEVNLVCPHIRSFKDVVTLNLTLNPSGVDLADTPPVSAIMASVDPVMTPRFVCPISGKEMNGKTRFSYLYSCGCVFSEQALREIPSSTCMTCAKPFTPDDIIQINPKPDELNVLRMQLPSRKKTKAEKKQSKQLENKLVNSQQDTVTTTLPITKNKVNTSTSLKRKQSIDSQKPKKAHITTTSLLNQETLAQATLAKKSPAIQSIYAKGQSTNPTDTNQTTSNDYMTRTFTRYA